MHLDKKFPLIQEGEKIKFVYLKLPNPYNNNTLAFISTIPKQLETDNWIDYDLQFQKAFIEPMGMILSSINWRSEKISSLEDLFA